jgi:class 3 adenylate cyclase/YHS domain-containing protein
MTTAAVHRLAALTATDPGDLTLWAQEGLVEVDPAEPRQRAIEQVRMVQLLRRRGFAIDDIVAAVKAQPSVFDRFVELAAANETGVHTVEEAAAAHGLDLDFVRRVWEASGLADQGEIGTDDDVASMRALDAAVRVGFPPDAVVQVVRVYADAMARIAEATIRLFHFHVHERLRAEGISGAELDALTTAAGDRLLPLVEPTVLYFQRKAFIRASREDLALHLAAEVGLVAPGDTTGQVPLTVMFVDLARFTAMTEAMGDLAAADVLDRFSVLVRRALLVAGGRVVKQIGDEFMVVFPDPSSGLRAGLVIRDAAMNEPSFLATRLGVHHGPVLCREGDYIGATVNVAARITAQAGPHQLLTSQAVRDAVEGDPDVTFAPAGTRRLKGIEDDVPLYEVVSRTGKDSSPARTVDPVCGMVVDPREAGARLDEDGREILFCSPQCRDRYLTSPDRYPSARP